MQSSSTYSVSTSQGNISIWDSHGSGKPVFFIHGNSACKEAFVKQFESDLAKNYRFIAMDLPGHGNSDKANDPENTYTIPGYADIAIEVINKLGLEKPVVLGWSLGGHIGLDMIKKMRIAGLLITGTPPIAISNEGFQQGFLPHPLINTLFGKIELSNEEAIQFMSLGGIDPIKNPFIVEAGLKTDGYARHYLAASFGKCIGGDQKEIVEADDTPLCVVQGENEICINNKHIVENVNYKNLFNKKVSVIKDSGHAVFWDKSNEFNEILGLFLANVC